MRTAPADPLTAAFTEHQAFVRERLRGLGVAPAELDDATQDVFEVLARRIADLDPNRPVRAWLAGVARKVARRHRERGRRVLLPIDEARLSSGASSPERRAAEVDARAVLDAFMAELDHDRWAVFVLAEIEGLRGTEIAAELDLNLNTVYARLRSARAAFERTLKRHHARDQRGRPRAWMLLPGSWPRPWRWASLGVATVGLVGGLSVVSRGGCAVEDEHGHAAEQPATVAIDPGQQDASVPHTRPLPAWMVDADHEADIQRRADQDRDPEAWREAGWGFAERSNDAGERFELTHELRYRLAGDQLILALTFTGDDDDDVDGIEASVGLDGFELVDGDAQAEISLAPAEVLTHTWTLRAVRVGPVATTLGIVAGSRGQGSRRLGFVAEPGRLRECEAGQCEPTEPATAASGSRPARGRSAGCPVSDRAVIARLLLPSPAMPRSTPLAIACLVLSACASGNTPEPAEPQPLAVAESEPTPERLEDVATITVSLVNECTDTKPFVLGPPEYPEVQPPADATVHELAAGERKTVLITPGQWFLHVDADGSFGSAGVSTTDDGAQVTFSASSDGGCSSMQVGAPPPA